LMLSRPAAMGNARKILFVSRYGLIEALKCVGTFFS